MVVKKMAHKVVPVPAVVLDPLRAAPGGALTPQGFAKKIFRV